MIVFFLVTPLGRLPFTTMCSVFRAALQTRHWRCHQRCSTSAGADAECPAWPIAVRGVVAARPQTMVCPAAVMPRSGPMRMHDALVLRGMFEEADAGFRGIAARGLELEFGVVSEYRQRRSSVETY